MFLAEGRRVLEEAAAWGKVVEIVCTDSRIEEAGLIRDRLRQPVPVHLVSEDLMGWVSDLVTSQGIMGIVEKVDVALEDLPVGIPDLILVADGVSDPGNMGSLMRIADASGADVLLATAGCVDVYNPKVVRAAAGAHFHLPVVVGVTPGELGAFMRREKVPLLGLDPRGDTRHLDADLTGRLALVVGNEASGISGELSGMLERTLYIEMPGRADSLNVASAAAVVVFEALRQREAGEG